MPATRRGPVILGVVVLCAHAFCCAMGHVVFVLGETSEQTDGVAKCGAMLNSFVANHANITTSLVLNSTGSLVPVQTAEVDVDFSPYCHIEYTLQPGDGNSRTLDGENLVETVEADFYPLVYNITRQLFGARMPFSLSACDTVFLYWLGQSLQIYNHLISAASSSLGDLSWPSGRNGAPGACPIANHPPAVQMPGSVSDFIPVTLTPFDTTWYTCTKGGETVSVPSGVLPIVDFTPPNYPVPVVWHQSGSIPVTRGSIKTCKLVPKPSLLIVTIVPCAFVFFVAVCLTCFCWSRCPVYKWRHPDDEKNKKTREQRLPK